MTEKHTIRSDEDMQRKRLEHEYREHRGDGPPPELDRAVIARAHRTLARERAGDKSRRRWPASRGTWLTGVATASVALLALAVVLQQAAPPARNLESDDLFNSGAPTAAARRSPTGRSAEPEAETAPDRSSGVQFQDFARQSRKPVDSQPKPPPPQVNPELEGDSTVLESAEVRASMKESTRALLEASAEAPPRERESRVQMPEADFDQADPEAFPLISADAVQKSIDAGDPPERIRDARRALFAGVQISLARGDDDVARALIEDHLSIDPEFELPKELTVRLAAESPSAPE